MSDTDAAPRVFSLRVRLLGYGLFLILILLMAELGARVLYWAWDSGLSDHLRKAPDPVSHIDVYERVDPDDARNWNLRPGTGWTLGQLIAAKAARGATLRANYLRDLGRRYGLGEDEVITRVNHAGYKGPELLPGGTRPRVLTIGDSCTFGTLLDRFSYPRALQSRLAGLGVDAEVINAGVEGYSPRNVRFRMDELLALKPDVVTIYLGWNALYDARIGNLHSIRLYRLYRTVEKKLFGAPAVASVSAGQAGEGGDADLGRWRETDLPFVEEITDIGDHFAAAGARVVLLTLPGLFLEGVDPGPAALAKGHLPPFTRDSRVLAALTANYNQRLRDLAADRGWQLVDLERWGRDHLKPRASFFLDSVHLVAEGQRDIGYHLAEQLRSSVAGSRRE
ncbi:MAG: SGNH/GDSL hydrolase family protein [Gammaproteobacteria bacterium]